MKTLFAICAFAVVSVMVVIETRRMVRKKHRRFVDRPMLVGQALANMFPNCGLSPSQLDSVLSQIENATDIPKGKLRPADRFDSELAPEKGWEYDDGLNCLQEALRSAFGGASEDYNITQHQTIHDLLRSVEKTCAASSRS